MKYIDEFKFTIYNSMQKGGIQLLGKNACNDVLGNMEDLLIVKGQLIKPEAVRKKDDSGYYIIFELKVVKESDSSKYETQFNSYSVIVPSKDVQTMAPVIKGLNKQEVICVIRPNARIRKGQNGGKFNSIDLYLEEVYPVNENAAKTCSLDDLTREEN